jgi:hypothetical protein
MWRTWNGRGTFDEQSDSAGKSGRNDRIVQDGLGVDEKSGCESREDSTAYAGCVGRPAGSRVVFS